MTPEEMKSILTNQYADYQEIKQANGDHENKELEYKMKRTAAILESLGVNV
ncbi:MAG: hypothetical protein J6O55_02890 [Lachnospiraceae bacterium]|nr:hypothetical protein [Lachnospiraceae bacterium]